MADEFYRFEDEDEALDENLNEAYNNWEAQLGGGGGAVSPLFKFKLVAIGKRRTWRDVVRRDTFNAELIQLRNPLPTDNMGLALTEALHEAIENEIQRERRPNHHFVNFIITANSFQHPYQSANFTVGEFLQRTVRINELLAKLAAKLNSNEAFDPKQGFQVDVVIVKTPATGRGRGKNRTAGQRCMDRENKKKKCIIPIRNNDDLCCARAIITMQAHCHRNDGVDGHRNWENLKSGQPVQEKMAKQLHQQAGVPEGPCGLEELQSFQEALGHEYQLLVMARIKPWFLIFKGPPAPHKIRLLKSNDHFDGVTAFTAFTNRSYYCLDCEKGFNTDDKAHHPCKGRRCTACARFGCPDYVHGTQPTDYCTQCHSLFYGIHCKRYHFDKKQCQTHKTCLKCKGQYFVIKGKRHRCGYAKCTVCTKWVFIADHKCYIQPVVEEQPEPTEEGGGCMVAPPPPLFVYADIEAMQNDESVFQANLLCYSTSEEETIHVLEGNHCISNFLHEFDDLAEVPESDKRREIIVVFHNLKGFDAMFIIHQLYEEQQQVTNQLTVGAKVLSFTSGTVKFIDSLSFLPMPLASFSSTFNISEVKKGFFPHLFNLEHHQNYVGRIPDLEFYDPDSLTTEKKEQLVKWHGNQVRQNVLFDFKKELISYCKSDVNLLKKGCEEFQKEFQHEAGFNPMEKSVTIAAACNLYWRKKHLSPDTIAVEPLHGWRGAQVNHSLKALQWLYWQENLLPKEGATADRIRHVRNGGEQRIHTSTQMFFVDGYDPATRTVYEFNGCFFHGCPSCYPNREIKHYAAPDRTVQELFNATEAKRMNILRAGYNVKEIWECKWNREVETNETVQQFLSSFDLVSPLEPRDVFFGGRTGAVSLHAKAEEGEIRYIDINSLYPWVNKHCEYPIGHPQIITKPVDQSIDSYFGIALVDVLPPSGLFHPVLPIRVNEKLTFPLCGSCVKEEKKKTIPTASTLLYAHGH